MQARNVLPNTENTWESLLTYIIGMPIFESQAAMIRPQRIRWVATTQGAQRKAPRQVCWRTEIAASEKERPNDLLLRLGDRAQRKQERENEMSRSAAAHQRDEDDAAERESYISEQVDALMDAENSDRLTFSAFVDEVAGELDGYEIVQLVLAVNAGKMELADWIAGRIAEQLAERAESLIIERIEA